MSERVLVIGASGLLGRALLRHQPVHIESVETPSSSMFDLERPESWEPYLSGGRVDRVVLSAAWTGVDDCELDPSRAYRLNGIVPGLIARQCERNGLRLTYMSTDYVFSGGQYRPYHESDPAAPLGVYAASKWSGECEVRESGARSLILRTSGLYGTGGPDFVSTIAGLLRDGRTVKVVRDQVLSPTWVDDLAPRVWRAVLSDHSGTFHLAAGGEVSWFDFAQRLSLGLGLPKNRVESTTSLEFGRPAPRPAYSALSSAKYFQYFEDSLLPWDQALDRRVREMSGRSE